jgi:receptor protein-tyrosine kinase
MKRSIVSAATPARGYWLFALGLALVGAVLALAISLAAPHQYEAHASLYVSTVGGASDSSAYQESIAAQQIALSLAKLVSSEVVADRVVQSLRLDVSASELASKIKATVEPETVLINLSVTDSSPTAARDVANATALKFTDFVDALQVNATPSTPRPHVTLVQPAVTPSVPISPNVARNVGLGTLAGLAIGLVYANLRERANRTVRDFNSLERVVGQPPLAAIPSFRSRNGRSVAVVTSDKSAMEGFKEVRTNLQHALDERSSRIVCVTSAGLKEGKTTTVIGIAIALSDAGHQVVVVDSDLRRADLSSQLELADTDGLTEVLSGKLEVGDVIHPSGLPRIDVIPSGHTSHQPSELLNSERAALLFRLLSEHYDFVLLDTPGLLAFTDAAVVAGHTDGVVLVARYAEVESNDLELAVASLQRVEARILGPVFTFAPVSESRRRSLKVRRGWLKSGVERHPRWLLATDDTDESVAGSADEGVAGSADEGVAGSADEGVAGSADEGVAGSAEDSPADHAEEKSQANHAGVEQRHERETRTLTEYTAEPDFDAGWSQESKLDYGLWPLLEHLRDLAADESLAGPADESLAGPAEDTHADLAEDSPANHAEEESQANHAGVELRHERETRALTEYTAEPDFDQKSKLDNGLWPLPEHMREFGPDGAADNHTIDRQSRSR